MTIQLSEGNKLVDRYLLRTDLSTGPGTARAATTWLAHDSTTHDPVVIDILPASADVDKIQQLIAQYAALIHPQILRTLACERLDTGDVLLVRAHRLGFEPMAVSPSAPTKSIAGMIEVIGTLQYAHDLGLVHGNLCLEHIQCGPKQAISLGGFGIPSSVLASENAHLSPKVRSGNPPRVEDDIYSVGSILHTLLTGKSWAGEMAETTVPIPDSLHRLIVSTLSYEAYDRPTDLHRVNEELEGFLHPPASEQIVPVSFRSSNDPAPSPIASDLPTFEREAGTQGLSTNRVVIAMAILLIAAMAFFSYQGNNQPVAKGPSATPPVAVPTPPESTQAAPFELARQEHLRKEADEIAAALLRAQLELEDLGGILWATTALETSQHLAEEGDELFRDRNYNGAIAKYQAGIDLLVPLTTDVSAVLANHLAKAAAALRDDDAQAAIHAFETALAIEPENAQATEGMLRASNLGKVASLIADARRLESEQALTAALDIYNKAAGIDPDSAVARQSIARVRARIADHKFQQAMSEGFQALRNADYKVAITRFDLASTIKPGSAQPAEGIAQVELAERQVQIEAFKMQAENSVAGEQWPAAIEAYQAALNLDASLLFASTGLGDAQLRNKLDSDLRHYLDDPLQLNDDNQLEAARKIFYQASLISKPGPILARQIIALSKHIKSARVPIQLQIVSDQQTNIMIYKVGDLGRIDATSLDLYPGVYTIVGTRKGYRDVRQQVTLLADKSIAPVTIRCTERI